MDSVLPLTLSQCADVFIAALILGFTSTIINLVQTNNERVSQIERTGYVQQNYIYDSKFDNTTVYAQDIVAMILQTRENKYVELDARRISSDELLRMSIDDILALVDNTKTYHAELLTQDFEGRPTSGEVMGYKITTS